MMIILNSMSNPMLMDNNYLKKLEEKSPELLSLTKIAQNALKQYKLENHSARVALCLDISGTMRKLYTSQEIQEFAKRILALAIHFDDDFSVDVFLFGGGDTHTLGAMTIDNFQDLISTGYKNYIAVGGTYYGKTMERIRDFYFPHEGKGEVDTETQGDRPSATAEQPVYVMFVTDGTTTDEDETIKQLMYSSYEPIFWQFMAVGKSQGDLGKGFWSWINRPFVQNFSFLKHLDDMEGRNVDNACFFGVKDPAEIKDEEVFDALMKEYPEWLDLAKEKKLLL